MAKTQKYRMLQPVGAILKGDIVKMPDTQPALSMSRLINNRGIDAWVFNERLSTLITPIQ